MRRFSTSIVDRSGPDGAYLRALSGGSRPSILLVRQLDERTLEFSVSGRAPHDGGETLVRRMLGTERASPYFDRAAAAIPWLAPLARAVRGVRNPRYATLWEACVNAVVFQQISLHAATAILRRAIVALASPVRYDEAELYPFPAPEALLAASDDVLGSAGLSVAKVATLRRVAEAITSGALNEAALEELPTADAATALCAIKGIGPWTAAVIALRGLGRLDTFPLNDSGVARAARELAGADIDLTATLEALGDERGMLYYHLLLNRLIATGEVVA